MDNFSPEGKCYEWKWSRMWFRSGRENYELILMLKNEVDHPAQAEGWDVTCSSTCVGTSLWCIFDVPPWVSTSIGLEDLHSTLYDVVDPYLAFNDVVDLYSTFNNVLDLWCQSVTSEVPLGAKNPLGTLLGCTLGKYYTHLMSGLGSGMPNM